MSNHLPLKDYAFITEFAAFCRGKGGKQYDCTDASKCALAQFGYPDVQMHELGAVPPDAFRSAVFLDGSGYSLFSALADRLDALLVHGSVVEKGS